MFKKNVYAAAAAMVLCSTGALADTFTFDPTGTPGAVGNITGAGNFDESPGNALGINGGGILTAGTQITVLYQANLGTVQNGNGDIIYTNGTVGGKYFTVVAGFGEKISNVTPDGNGITFQYDPTGLTNFFRVYANTVGQGNNLTGQGFTAGSVIMSGVFVAPGFASGFSRSLTTPGLVNFDQSSDGDQYGGYQSINGSGSTSINANINFVDNNYFPDLFSGSTFTFFNTSQNVPFTSVNPSQQFTAQDGSTVLPVRGSQNGGNTASSGRDFQLLADANQTFTRPSLVPEPDSLAMLGLGLGIIAVVSRRRKKAV